MKVVASHVEQLIEASPEAVAVVDSEGCVLRSSDAFRRLLGDAERETVDGILYLAQHAVFQRMGFTDAFPSAVRGEATRSDEIWLAEAGRPARVVRLSYLPLRNQSGDVVQVVLWVEDLTSGHAAADALERCLRQIARLQDAFRGIGDSASTEAAQQAILDAMLAVGPWDACAIWRVSPEGRWRCDASKGLSQDYRDAVTEAYAAAPPHWRAPLHQTQEGRAVVIEDTRTAQNLTGLHDRLAREGVGRVVAAPMRSGDAVDGTLIFYGREPGAMQPGDVDVAMLLADQAAIALHNTLLIEEATSAAAEARLLYETAAIVTQSLRLPDVLRAIADAVAPLLSVERIHINRVDLERGELHGMATLGVGREWTGADRPEQNVRIADMSEGMQRLVATGESMVLDDATPEWLATLPGRHRENLQRRRLQSILIVALKEGDRVAGTMSFDTPGQVRRWTARDVRLAEGVAAQVATALHNARLFEEAREIRETLEQRVEERTQKLRDAHTEVIAAERLAAVGIMAREVGHGLRNPLNVVSTSLYYLKSRFADPDDRVALRFEAIERSIDDAAEMINQLMSIAGPRQPEFEPVDLNLLVQRALQDRFTGEVVRWEAEWDPDLPPVRGDWTQINHAVKALIGNAASADTDAPILIRTSHEAGIATLGVGDRRPHLTEERRRALFEPFFVSATEWTGLGLSVARQIADRHHGTVTVSEANGITWFLLTLPLFENGV